MAEQKLIPKKCEIISWNATSFWKWDTDTTECTICRNHIMNSCIECSNSENKALNESCKIVTGKCGCSFHYHCIQNWIKSNSKCPHHTSVKWNYKITQ